MKKYLLFLFLLKLPTFLPTLLILELSSSQLATFKKFKRDDNENDALSKIADLQPH